MKKRAITIAMSMMVVMSGCQSNDTSSVSETEEDVEKSESEYFSDKDLQQDYDSAETVYITMNEDSAEAEDDSVTINGSTITVNKGGVYVFSGILNQGSITVDAEEDEKVQIVLDEVTVNNSSTACIYAKNADKVFVTLLGKNNLIHTGSYETSNENTIDGVIFAKCDLTLNGSGTLKINDDSGHGVVCKDELVITGGSYDFNVARHGFQAKKSIAVTSAAFAVAAGKDGFHVENKDDETKGSLYIQSGTFNVSCEGDGFDVADTIIIDSGSFNVTTGGGSEQATMKQEESFGHMWNSVEEGEEDSTSKKGMKSGGSFVINSGDFTMNCYDDALHSNSTLMIQDGTFTVKTGDDAIHADTDLTIYSGSYDISYCYEGFEGLTVTFYDGTYSITSNDDGVNAAGNGTPLITVEGGMFTIVSDGDSLDSNGDIVINGGTLNLTCNGNSNTAIDVDGSYTCNGGTVITNDGSENGSGRMGPGGKRDNRYQDKMEYKEYA